MEFQNNTMIQMVIFDFGGVLSEKGFEEGLRAIAARHDLDRTAFYSLAHELIYSTGYITNQTDEHRYWQMIRLKTGIGDSDAVLRNEILSRFILRHWMFDIIMELRANGIGTAILSDQTNWLDELDKRYTFFKYFDAVFNSYHLGKSKRELPHFFDIANRLHHAPRNLLFVDDSEANCGMARKAGMKVIRYVNRDLFLRELAGSCPIK